MSVIVLLWGTVKGQNAGSIAVNRNALYNTYTPAQLVQNVLITGCLTAKNVTFKGLFNATDPSRRQLGYFNQGTSNFPISEGLVLSTGYARASEGPNNSPNSGQELNYPGDDDLNMIVSPRITEDAAVLEFDFIPAGNTLEFQYIFSSEEYLEWTCSPYNDAFGFFLSGPGIAGPYSNGATNIALIPATAIPVTINNVHQYTANGYNNQPCAAQNAAYYVNNFPPPDVAGPYRLTTQFDGMTVVMTATYPVTACSTYHIKLAIGDTNDGLLNSGVFLKARSFNSEPIGASNINTNVNLPDYSNIFEGCPGNQIVLQRDPAYISQPATVQILYGGTATNGIDVKTTANQPLPATVTIPAGVLTYTINYSAVDDGIPDAGEDLIIQVLQSCPCDPNPVYVTKTITIWEKNLTVTAQASNVDCNSTYSGSISAIAHDGSGDNLFSIDGVNWQGSNLFTGLAQGTYTIWAKNVGSCANPVSTSATINPANTIVANAGSDITICTGESAQLQGSGGSIYSWSPQTGLSDPQIPDPVASPNTTTTYTLTVTDPTGNCSSTDDVIVNVNQSPVAEITLPNNGNVCVGNTGIKLTATGGGTYEWNLVPVQTTPSITVTPSSSTSYTVIVTGANGCKADVTANVIVHPLPTAVLSGDATICSEDPASLNVSLTGTGPWIVKYTDGTTTYTETADYYNYDFPVFPSITTTYTLVSVTDYFGCTATDITGSATVTISPLPLPPASVSVDPASFCPGGVTTITLTATGGTGISTNWYEGSCQGNLIGTVPLGNTLTIPAPGITTTYYASNINSCGISDCISVTANITAPPTAPTSISTGGQPVIYCENNLPPGIYRLTANGATNATGYEWFIHRSDGTPIPGITTNVYLLPSTPLDTTTYWVRATNANCAPSPFRKIVITVYKLPTTPTTVTASPNPVCAGVSLTLMAIGGSGGTGLNPVLNWYTGSCGGTLIGSGTPLIITAPAINTTYYARWQNDCGNSACQSVLVVVNPLPTITGNLSVCIGSTTQLTGSGTSAVSTPWISASTDIATVSNSGLVTGIAAGTSLITYTNSNGCSTSVTVTVNALPTISGTLSLCINSTTQLTGSGTAATSNPWVSASPGVATVTSSGLVTGVTAGTATITYKDNNGCSTTKDVTVLQPLQFTVTGSGSYCSADGSTLSVDLSGSEIGVNYQLYLNNNPVAGAILAGTGGPITFGIQSVGVYTVKATMADPASCSRDMLGGANIRSYTSPSVFNVTDGGAFCAGGTGVVVGLSGSQNGYSYQLYVDGVPSGTPVNRVSAGAFSFPNQTTPGVYTVIATRSTAPFCPRTMNSSVNVTVNPLPSITGALNVCVGKTTQWSGSGTPDPTIPWSSATPGFAIVDNSGNVTGVSAGTSVITYKDNKGCSQTQTITVDGLIPITSPTNKTGCSGSQVTFTATYTYNQQVHFQWYISHDAGATWDIISGANGNPTTQTPIQLTLTNIGQNGVDVDQTQYRVIITPNSTGCAVISDAAILTVNPNITPTFAAVAPICSGATLSPLPTISTNGITGTWSPALNNTATTTYTFTPTAGLCATTTTLTITVNPNITPTFAAVSPICSGATLSPLPTTSTNGITGTWSPALNNTATTTYTFTPTAGLCATTTTLTITVNPNITPTFTAVAPICSGATLTPLPTTSTNGITGTWSPALNNTATTIYTFTPTVGLCATTTILTITVNPLPTTSAIYHQ